uniref:type I protein arginine methyltransferase n=1 Tax=Glossina austeni TaxID=7395 RepID=A0A1A9VRD1_GLOAU
MSSRKLKRLMKCPGHGENKSTVTMTSTSPVDKMTSFDFAKDGRAHIEMIDQSLKDNVRIVSFKSAILHNKHLFRGRVVLNLNCGVGLFALFAAKAGAARVFAVDNSNVLYYAKLIVQNNGYNDIIQVMKGEITEIELPVDEVDIIVCDWMGQALLHQSTCVDVLYARDKWLKKSGGLIFPDKARLFVAAIEDERCKNGNIEWWKHVYGFNMNCLREVAIREPRYQSVKVEQLLSKQYPIQMLNLNKATCEDLYIRSKYKLHMQRCGRMDGIVLFFHVYFSKSHTRLAFSTDPWSPLTNWLQTVFFLDQSLSVDVNSVYYGGIELYSPESSHNLENIMVNFEMLKGEPSHVEFETAMNWHMISSRIPRCVEFKAIDHSYNEADGSQGVNRFQKHKVNILK